MMRTSTPIQSSMMTLCEVMNYSLYIVMLKSKYNNETRNSVDANFDAFLLKLHYLDQCTDSESSFCFLFFLVVNPA